MQLKRKATTNSPKLKPIPKYSKKYWELEDILTKKTSEKKRKEILETLPEKSFAKKFYSNKNLQKEICLIKIGKEVFDISIDRTDRSTNYIEKLLYELFKKYDLSKATMIHQHPVELPLDFAINVDLSVFDYSTNVDLCKRYGIKNFMISFLNENMEEAARLFYTFPKEQVAKIKNLNLKKFIEQDKRSINGTITLYDLLKSNKIMVQIKPMNGYELKFDRYKHCYWLFNDKYKTHYW